MTSIHRVTIILFLFIPLSLKSEANNAFVRPSEPPNPITTPIREGKYAFDLIQENADGIIGGERFEFEVIESDEPIWGNKTLFMY